MITFSAKFDSQDYRTKIRQFAELTGRKLGEVIRDEMRLLVGVCINRTPPFSGKALARMGNEGHSGSAKKVGERAVERDIRYLFRPVSGLDLYANNEHFRKAADRHELATVRGFLKDAKRFGGVGLEPDPEFHQRNRDGRGRVRLREGWIAIVNESALRAYIRRRQKLVGYARAGWNAAKAAFGASGWTLKGAGAPGSFRDETRNNLSPKAEAANLVPYIQWAEGKFGIVRGALRQRQMAIAAKIRRVVTGTFNSGHNKRK